MTRDPTPAPDPRGFWQWFSDHERELLDIVRGERADRITDRLDRALERFGLTYTYEVTESELGGELTFTPEGDPALAPAVDQLVAAAPTLEHWIFHSRRQRKKLSAALAFVHAVHGVDLSGARFQARFDGDRYHLRFIHPGLAALDEDRRFAVAGAFLDHALGEDVAMSFIGGLDFVPEDEGIEMGLMINELIRETATILQAS